MKEEIKTAEIVMHLSNIETKQNLDGEVYELTYFNHDGVLMTKLIGKDRNEIQHEIIVEVQCL